MATVSRPPSSYLFLAARPDGGRRVGLKRARDRRHLAEQLRAERMVPLQTWVMPAWLATPEKVGLKDEAELHQQLAQLLSRGVPLTEALEVTSQTVGPKARPKVQRIRELVAAGSAFSDACAKAGMFDSITVAVYRAAERTGDLPAAAQQLSTTARRQLAMKGKVGTLLIYPIIVMSISVLVVTMLLTVVVPKVAESMQKDGANLPWVTELLMVTGNGLRNNALWAILAVMALGVLVFIARRSILAGGAWLARRVPLLRDVLLTQEIARFFTVMAAMTRSGIVLAEALGTATTALSHPKLRAELETMRTKLIEGGVLRVLIERVESMPLGTRRLLIAAERSGDLESAFDTLAADTVNELDVKTTRLMAALEPALLVLMFLMVGSLILAIMVPIIQATAERVG